MFLRYNVPLKNSVGDPLVQYIPDDAETVMALNMAEISAKLDLTEVDLAGMGDQDSEKSKESEVVENIFKDPASFGLNDQANWFFYANDIEDNNRHAVLVIPLSDRRLLNTRLKDAGMEVEKNDKIHFLSETGEATISWNDEVLLLSNKSGSELAVLFDKTKSNIGENESFKKLETDGHDVMAFVQSSDLLPKMLPMSASDDIGFFNKWLKDNAAISYLDFNTGSVEGNLAGFSK